MTTALDYVRNSCGIAGEEVAEMVDRLEAEIALLSIRKTDFTEGEKEQFSVKVKDLMQWLNANGNPHMTIVITTTTAELLEGLVAIHSTEYVRG